MFELSTLKEAFQRHNLRGSPDSKETNAQNRPGTSGLLGNKSSLCSGHPWHEEKNPTRFPTVRLHVLGIIARKFHLLWLLCVICSIVLCRQIEIFRTYVHRLTRDIRGSSSSEKSACLMASITESKPSRHSESLSTCSWLDLCDCVHSADGAFPEMATVEVLELVFDMTMVPWNKSKVMNTTARRATKRRFKLKRFHSAFIHDRRRGRMKSQHFTRPDTLAEHEDHRHISCVMAQMSYKEPIDHLDEVDQLPSFIYLSRLRHHA